MKNIVAIIAVALTTAAPVYAESAAELFALSNDSAAERAVNTSASTATKASSDLLRFFALGNDSAAERNVK